MLKLSFVPSLERIRPAQFFIFKFKALFGSKLRATKNKLFLRKFVKRFLILLISSNLAFLAPLANKDANIRNRYNYVPHLTQDTNGKVIN